MSENVWKFSKNRGATVRILGKEPAWLAYFHQNERLMKRLDDKTEMFKLVSRIQEDRANG